MLWNTLICQSLLSVSGFRQPREWFLWLQIMVLINLNTKSRIPLNSFFTCWNSTILTNSDLWLAELSFLPSIDNITHHGHLQRIVICSHGKTFSFSTALIHSSTSAAVRVTLRACYRFLMRQNPSLAWVWWSSALSPTDECNCSVFTFRPTYLPLSPQCVFGLQDQTRSPHMCCHVITTAISRSASCWRTSISETDVAA